MFRKCSKVYTDFACLGFRGAFLELSWIEKGLKLMVYKVTKQARLVKLYKAIFGWHSLYAKLWLEIKIRLLLSVNTING